MILILFFSAVLMSALCLIGFFIALGGRPLTVGPDIGDCIHGVYRFNGRVVSNTSLQGLENAGVRISSRSNYLFCELPGSFPSLSTFTNINGFFSFPSDGYMVVDSGDQLVLEVQREGCSTYTNPNLDLAQFRFNREVDETTRLYEIQLECSNE